MIRGHHTRVADDAFLLRCFLSIIDAICEGSAVPSLNCALCVFTTMGCALLVFAPAVAAAAESELEALVLTTHSPHETQNDTWMYFA